MTGELIREIKIQGKDDEGRPETSTIRVSHTDEGFEVDWLVDDVIVDSTTCDTRAEADRKAREWADLMARDYRENERERRAEERRLRRDLVNDLAADFAGDDAQALRMVAALIGQGRSAAAVKALRAVNRKREEGE